MADARYYDHASNHANPAQAQAVARARRTAIAEGQAYRVDFKNSKGESFYFNGCRYDCLSLAKDLLGNRMEVSLTNARGEAVDIAAARY